MFLCRKIRQGLCAGKAHFDNRRYFIDESEHRKAEFSQPGTQFVFLAFEISVAKAVESLPVIHFRKMRKLMIDHELAQFLRQEHKPRTKGDDSRRRTASETCHAVLHIPAQRKTPHNGRATPCMRQQVHFRGTAGTHQHMLVDASLHQIGRASCRERV